MIHRKTPRKRNADKGFSGWFETIRFISGTSTSHVQSPYVVGG